MCNEKHEFTLCIGSPQGPSMHAGWEVITGAVKCLDVEDIQENEFRVRDGVLTYRRKDGRSVVSSMFTLYGQKP